MRVLAGRLVLAALLAAAPDAACTIFTVTADDHVYMGNNEDYIEPGFVWFVPAGKKRYGRVSFGFADRFAQVRASSDIEESVRRD